MGGSVNLRGGGQYQMPTTGTGETYSPSYTPSGYGARYGGYGQQYGGFGQQYGPGIGLGQGLEGVDLNNIPNVSTGGKGFQQQPQYNYQPAPVMQPYVNQVSTGGKGFQNRQTPAQSVAYAPMNIPQMQLAQPSFYYPNIGSQMANLQATSGLGGLGALGAFGNYPMMPRQPAPMQMYPALQQPPPTSTGGKGFRPNPPTQPPMLPPRNPNPDLRPVLPSNPNLSPVSPRNPFEPTVQPIRYEDRELPRADQRIPQLEDSIYRDMPLFVPGYSNEPLVKPQASPYIADQPYVSEEYDRPYVPADVSTPSPVTTPFDRLEEPVYAQPALEEPAPTSPIDRFEEPMYDTQDRSRGFMDID
jgi:hypothetical protein